MCTAGPELMCSSSWKLYLDELSFFGSTLADLEPDLGKDPATKLDVFFGKVPKGWGIIFNPKNYVADFGNFKQGFLSMQLINRKVISGCRVCFFNNCIDID